MSNLIKNAQEEVCENSGGHAFVLVERYDDGTPENITKVEVWRCTRCGKVDDRTKPGGSVWNQPVMLARCNKCNGQVYSMDLRGHSIRFYCRSCGQISANDTHRS